MTVFYKVHDTYVSLADISSISSYEKEDQIYKYGLTVGMKNGQTHGVIYKYKKDRDAAVKEILEKAIFEAVTIQGIMKIVQGEIEKVRRDIKNLKKELKNEQNT